MWAGLYCMPVFDSRDALEQALTARLLGELHEREPFLHVLTHKDLHLHPVQARVAASTTLAGPGQWFAAHEWPALGLPAPVRRLLQAG